MNHRSIAHISAVHIYKRGDRRNKSLFKEGLDTAHRELGPVKRMRSELLTARAFKTLLGFLVAMLAVTMLVSPGMAQDKSVLAAEKPPAWLSAYGPFTHWYPDETELVDNRNSADQARRWRDRIGRPVFDTSGIAVYWREDAVYLALVTNFRDANVNSAGRPVSPADLALDLDNDGQFETAVVLSDIRRTGDRGVVRPEGVRMGEVYTVSRWQRPDDLLHHTYGQGWRWYGPDDKAFAQSAVPVWMAEGVRSSVAQANVEWHDDPRGQGSIVLIELRSLDPEQSFVSVPLVWGTAVCGNDVVFAVPTRLNELVETGGLLPSLAPAGGDGPAPGGGHGPVGGGQDDGAAWNVPYHLVFAGGGGGAGGGQTGGGQTGGGGQGGGGGGTQTGGPVINGGGPGGGFGGGGTGGGGTGGTGGTGGGTGGTGGTGGGTGGTGGGTDGTGGGTGGAGGGTGGPGGPGGGSGSGAVTPVSEPHGLALFGAGVLLLAWARRRRIHRT